MNPVLNVQMWGCSAIDSQPLCRRGDCIEPLVVGLGVNIIDKLNIEGEANGPDRLVAAQRFQCPVIMAAALSKPDAAPVNRHQWHQNHIRHDERGIRGWFMDAVQAGLDDRMAVDGMEGERGVGVGAGQGDRDACGEQVRLDCAGVDFPRCWSVAGDDMRAMEVRNDLCGESLCNAAFDLRPLRTHGLHETAALLPDGGAQLGLRKSGC